MGSKCYVIESETWYILNGNGEWVPFVGEDSTAGGSGDVTPAAVVAATAAMTPEQAAETRQNIGADTPETVTEWLDAHVDPDTGYVIDNSLTVEGAAADAKATGDKVSELKSAFSNIEEVVLGDVITNFTPNKNLSFTDGEEVDDDASSLSEFIPYTWTGNARFYCSENGATKYAYKIAFYDANKVKLNVFQYPATDGGVYRNINAETQVSGTPAFVKFSFEKNFDGKITNSTNPPTVEYWVTNEYCTQGLVDTVNTNSDISAKTKLYLGSDSINIEASTLAANTQLKLDTAPWFIMKNQGVSAMAKFDTFTSFSVGKGYMNYRGRWITVDNTYVHIYATKDDLSGITEYDINGKYEGQTGYEGPVAHGLTISNFIEISMYETADGKIKTHIDTLSGDFSVNIDSLYRWNYSPFIMGGQAMTGTKLGYSCADIRSPLWMFGDSYLGIAVNRVGGQLRNSGFTSYLMDSIAGGRAVDDGNPGKSISGDLNKLLAMGTPQYIVWTLGMNGTIQMNIDYIEELKTMCEDKKITLILYMPPSVPNNDKTTLNAYIAETGLRYINAYDAVGANAQGVWYNGFLSSDNVHPSTLGAKAISMRFLADVPELMQYGYSTGAIDSESEDGNEM